MIELLVCITIFWYQILIDHNGHIHSLLGQTNHIIGPSSQTPTPCVLWQSDSHVYVHGNNTARPLQMAQSWWSLRAGWNILRHSPSEIFIRYQENSRNIAAVLKLMHCVLKSECRSTACVFITSLERSIFLGIIGVQFFQTELEPVRRVSADANLKRFLAQSTRKKPTLNMGEFRMVRPIAHCLFQVRLFGPIW